MKFKGGACMDFLVLDVGGSSIKYAVMNEKSEFIEKGKVPTPKGTIESFVEAVGSIYDKYEDRIEGIAMSMPGRIDSDRGYCYTGGALLYNYDKDIAGILGKRCPVPITIENDGKCAALAEAWIGSLSDCNDGIVVVLGTGIGGGIIKDKKLHKGANFTAGEFSFMITSPEINNGVHSKIWAMESGSRALLEPVSVVKNIPLEELDGFKVFEYANDGDEEVLKILDEFCYKIVVQLFNLQYIYDPEKIAIGGGISAQDILIEYIYKNIEKHRQALFLEFTVPTVVRCKFQNDANLIGALSHFIAKQGY